MAQTKMHSLAAMSSQWSRFCYCLAVRWLTVSSATTWLSGGARVKPHTVENSGWSGAWKFLRFLKIFIESSSEYFSDWKFWDDAAAVYNRFDEVLAWAKGKNAPGKLRPVFRRVESCPNSSGSASGGSSRSLSSSGLLSGPGANLFDLDDRNACSKRDISANNRDWAGQGRACNSQLVIMNNLEALRATLMKKRYQFCPN